LAIFLHFLNREIFRSVNAQYSLRGVESALRVVALGLGDELISNYSNLLESGMLTAGEPNLVTRLLASNQISIEGERASFGEFLESRTRMYAFDASRYPMYFDALSAPFALPPAYVRASSITQFIATEINFVDSREKTFAEVGACAQDARPLAQTVRELNSVVLSRGDSGITRSLFAGKLGTMNNESAAARLISAIYVRSYIDSLGCTIATGIPHLTPFDSLSNDLYSKNVAVVNHILQEAARLEGIDLRSVDDTTIAASRGSDAHRLLTRSIESLCFAAGRAFQAKTALAAKVTVANLLSPAAPSRQLRPSSIDPFSSLNLGVLKLIDIASRYSPCFADHISKGKELMGMKTVLLVTATPNETRALFAAASEATGVTPRAVLHTNYVLHELGELGSAHLVHVQCEAGSTGQANSQAVVTDAIRDARPDAIIMGGIAFGAKKDKQQLGDILVGKMIVEYEKAKIKEGESFPRGQRSEASPKLLSIFRSAEAQSRGIRVQFGTILSGEKLIDSEPFLQGLLRQEPEAIGGEMEGAGLMGAAHRAKTDWIVVKAIVDWAHGKAQNNGDEHQISVAKGAFQFILDAIKVGFQ
jgi:nucleoside phosphorylase